MSTSRQSNVGDQPSDPGEIGPRAAWRLLEQGAVLVDVRDAAERALGHPGSSKHVPLGQLMRDIRDTVPDPQCGLLLICAAGTRSAQAAQWLRQSGYPQARSVAGGCLRWRAEGLPFTAADGLGTALEERYDRHLRLPEVGVVGQRRLLEGRVALVGAGGLGSPAGFYLAAAGIGTLTLIDDDRVERSNLQRQILHVDGAVGTPKVESARTRLSALNPDVRIRALAARLDASNARTLLAGHDFVIDGADNFATRYLLDATCRQLGLPWAYGAVQGFAGQASTFIPGRGPCYRCLFPEPPEGRFAPNCAESGVLGVVPGVIGLIQATEAIKHLIGLGQSLSGRLLGFDALALRFTETRLVRDPVCPGCGPGKTVVP